MKCDLPDGFILHGFQSGDFSFAGSGWLLEGTVQEPPLGTIEGVF